MDKAGLSELPRAYARLQSHPMLRRNMLHS